MLLTVISVVVGVTATLLNGEELFFIAIDIAIVGVFAGSVVAASNLWRRVAVARASRPKVMTYYR